MGRLGTGVVVAALSLLGLAAALDALRGERVSEAPAPTEPAREAEARAVIELEAAGIGGVLTWSDEDCRLHALVLPALDPRPAPAGRSCAFTSSAPGGVTTAVVGGEVPSADDLARAFPGRGKLELAELAWFDETRLAAIVRAGSGAGGHALFAVFDGRRPIGSFPLSRRELSGLRISPRAGYAAARTEDGVAVLDRLGNPVRVPQARAIAWSPDERWTAVAMAASVYIFPTSEDQLGLIRLPLDASDLAWR